MVRRRYGTFTGGIDLPDEKQRTLYAPIEPAPRMPRLRVPLASSGPAARAVVRIGQYVTVGEKIALAEGDSCVDVVAPLSGRVSAFTMAAVAARDGFVDVPAIELTELSIPGGLAPLEATFDWRKADSQTLRRRIAEGGLVIHRPGGGPLAQWAQSARGKKCRWLIANVMESQPYVTANHRLLADHGAEVIRGLALLGAAVEAREIVLAVDRRRTDDYRELVGPAGMYRISRIALPHKYPTGADPILVKILTNREMPPGRSTMDVGAAVIDAASCFAAYRWVGCGCPPTGRVVTVSGERAPRPGNFWAPFGADCAELLAGAAEPIIHGGPMNGLRCPSGAVVSASTDAVLAITAWQPRPPGPCIRCGWCRDHCPARLNVGALNDTFELGRVDRAARLGVMASVECGVCTYVCPARLPLSQRVKQLKRAVAGENLDKHLGRAGKKA